MKQDRAPVVGVLPAEDGIDRLRLVVDGHADRAVLPLLAAGPEPDRPHALTLTPISLRVSNGFFTQGGTRIPLGIHGLRPAKFVLIRLAATSDHKTKSFAI